MRFWRIARSLVPLADDVRWMPRDLIEMQGNLPVIDYSKGPATAAATERCPTGAIVWLDPQAGIRQRSVGPQDHSPGRNAGRPDLIAEIDVSACGLHAQGHLTQKKTDMKNKRRLSNIQENGPRSMATRPSIMCERESTRCRRRLPNHAVHANGGILGRSCRQPVI